MKTLNLEKLQMQTAKITLGFKCDPKLKLKLAQDAQKLKLSLSEYVESIVLNYDPTLIDRLNKLSEALNFYENNLLKKLYADNKNETFEITTVNGEIKKVKINTMYDVYDIIINSFKTQV